MNRDIKEVRDGREFVKAAQDLHDVLDGKGFWRIGGVVIGICVIISMALIFWTAHNGVHREMQRQISAAVDEKLITPDVMCLPNDVLLTSFRCTSTVYNRGHLHQFEVTYTQGVLGWQGHLNDTNGGLPPRGQTSPGIKT